MAGGGEPDRDVCPRHVMPRSRDTMELRYDCEVATESRGPRSRTTGALLSGPNGRRIIARYHRALVEWIFPPLRRRRRRRDL